MAAPRRVPAIRPRDIPALLSHRVRPASATTERTLPVAEALAPLFPTGLPRGATFTVSGDAGRSFLFATVATATHAGAWLAVLGLEDPGWCAIAELGVDTARIVHVDPGRREADCVAAALDGFDLVAIGPRLQLGGAVQRRLTARARERGAVLFGADGALERVADVSVQAQGEHWQGLGSGWGHLSGRRVTVNARGRRLPGRHREGHLWLPDASGGIAPVAQTAATTTLSPAGRARSA